MDAHLVAPTGTDADITRPAVTVPAVPAVPAPQAPVGAPRAEPLLLGVLALGGALAAWATGARPGSWSAPVAVAVLAVSAWTAERPGAGTAIATGSGTGNRGGTGPGRLRLGRAVMCLAAAGVAVGAHAAPAPVALAWLPAVCAVYGLLLPPRSAAALVVGALAVLTALDLQAPARSSNSFAVCAVAAVAAGLAASTARSIRLTAPRQAPAAAVRAGADVVLHALARAQERSGVVGGGVGLLLVTLDGTASLQAELGRAGADGVLETLARRARALLPAGDAVARLGDTRMAVVLEGVDERTCAVVARRLAGLLAEPVTAGQRVLWLTSLVAVTLAGDPAEEPAALLARAERVPPVPADELPLAAAPAQETPRVAVQDPAHDTAHDPAEAARL